MVSIAVRFESEFSLPALVVSMAGRFESEPSPANLGGISIAGRLESGLSLPALMVSMAGRFEIFQIQDYINTVQFIEL